MNDIANSDQVRMARVLLDWSQEDLAKHAGLSRTTIAAFESGRLDARMSTIRAITRAFTEAGVRFTQNGVKRTTP